MPKATFIGSATYRYTRGGGTLRISSDRDDWMGAKTLDQNLTPKKSHAQFPSHKIFHKALTDMTRKIETLVLNTPKNPHLNQAIQKNTLQNFPTKKIPKSKISNQKNPSIILVTTNLESPRWADMSLFDAQFYD